MKHISGAYREGNPDSAAVPVSIVRRIALYTGIVGALLAIALSAQLSLLTFGDRSHTFSFLWLSATLLFKQLTAAELSVLQSLRKLKWLARVNFYGNLAGLLFAAPLYYLYGIDAIVPAIIAASVFAMVFSFVYARKIKIKKAIPARKDFLKDSKAIMKLGIVMTFSSVLTLVASWLIQIYVSRNGGTSAVGFYNAGFALLNSYVGLLFTAMATDYFPRLSALVNDEAKMKTAVLEQSIIGVLIMTPVVAVFLAFSSQIIGILFTKSFYAILMMVSVGMLGMLFRIVSFSIGYMILAKADTGLFVKNAIGFNLLYFVSGIAGYYFYGLTGLGIAFVVHYFFHFVILALIAYFRYNFTFDREFAFTYAACIIFAAAAFGFTFIGNDTMRIAFSEGMALISITFSIYRINRKTDVISFFRGKKQP